MSEESAEYGSELGIRFLAGAEAENKATEEICAKLAKPFLVNSIKKNGDSAGKIAAIKDSLESE